MAWPRGTCALAFCREAGIMAGEMGEAKRKNQRECPALGRRITAEECGGGRNSRIPCPVECPHNPYAPANYLSMQRPIEDRVVKALQPMLFAEMTPVEARDFGNLLRAEDTFGFHALSAWMMHGTGRVARWEREGRFRSWRNDDQVMAGHLQTTRPALLEIQRWEDEGVCRVRDLLRPEEGEKRLVDSSFAARATRYQSLLTWVHETPAGWRIIGSAAAVPAILPRGPREVLDIMLEHLGAPAAGRDLWLFEHMALVGESLAAIGDARNRAGLLAGDWVHHSTTYQVVGKPEPLLRMLRSAPDIVEDGGTTRGGGIAFTILEPGFDIRSPGGVPTLGTLDWEGGEVVLESVGAERHAKARAVFEGIAGALARFSGETTRVPGEAKPGPPPDPDLVPSCLLEGAPSFDFVKRWMPAGTGDRRQVMLAGFRETYRDFADTPLPVLGGVTPRAAAADPALRPLLVEVMKTHLTKCDEQRRRGIDLDINGILAELGLDEWIQPPVPVGEFEEEDEDWEDEEDDEEEDEEDDEEEGLPDLPPCPQVVLEEEEVKARLHDLGSDAGRLEELYEQWDDLSNLLDKLLLDDLSDGEFGIVLEAALLAAAVLHPRRAPGVKPDPRRTLRRMARHMEQVHEWLQRSRGSFFNQVDGFVRESAQPAVCLAALALMAQMAEADKTGAVDRERIGIGAIAVLAVIGELTQWPPSERVRAE